MFPMSGIAQVFEVFSMWVLASTKAQQLFHIKQKIICKVVFLTQELSPVGIYVIMTR